MYYYVIINVQKWSDRYGKLISENEKVSKFSDLENITYAHTVISHKSS